jgi:serine protease
VVGFPANHPEVIAVGAVEATNTRTAYANYGTALTLMAPGGDTGQDADGDGIVDGILQETLGRACGSPAPFTLCLFQGTSMAAPHVAGAVAILRSAVPTATRYAIQNALITTALDQGEPGFDPFYGYGSIRIPAALAALGGELPPDPPTPTPEPTPTPSPGGTNLPPALYLPLLGQ